MPLVSICCTTYNQEKYIRDSIEGFLIQKTTFPIEIIVHDDASTDNTALIVKEYAKKHPDLIVPIYQAENQYSQGIKPWPNFVFPRARGKYIALCEGDDYWTDPNKLQKQVDFLEKNPEYGLVHCDCNFYYHEKDKWENNANKNLSNSKEIINKEDLFRLLIDADYKIRTATVLFKKELLDKRLENNMSFAMGDTPMWLDFSQVTKFKYFNEVSAVYRIISNSASRSVNKRKHFRFALSMAEMRIYYSEKYNYQINDKLKKRYNKSLINYKVYHKQYNEPYPLFDPTFYQSFQFKNIKYDFFRSIFQLEILIVKYFNAFVNKIKQ